MNNVLNPKPFILLILAVFLSFPSLIAQNKTLSFDGINDYVDLGTATGNSLRTIEMWIKPNQDITPQNSTIFRCLIMRNTGLTSADPFEFGLTFDFLSGSEGKLRFLMTDQVGARYHILSDTANWNANQWYHIVAVVDSVQGMMLFVDGKKQSDTNSYSGNTGVANAQTSLGRWGNFNARYFNGEIDNVKLSAFPIYTSNFIPECPNPPNKIYDGATYLFQENGGMVAIDSSQQQYHAVIYGGSRVQDSICSPLPVGVKSSTDVLENTQLMIYPNPSKSVFYFKVQSSTTITSLTFKIIDFSGKEVLSQELVRNEFSIDMSHLNEGIYFYQLMEEGSTTKVGKLVKL